ncbi:uncharacterized protein N7483_013219 [Penicillium malachiteum]|uniref:uncharacterized protein n=1 Tax=Penicillium malachiteum TaxID=1324776 RepID=UPI00254879E7|nr:uncharacterized protein N7483_013219 [Penicillium malachiteum]KAJ5716038.1 hypothetical protein N7483_013219 [Penicillium malachiteum]
MKFLCCHGFGTSPQIMKQQLAKIKKYCDPSWEFHFVAGQYEAPPDPSIAAAFPGPYLCYSLDFNTTEMKSAHQLIDDTVASHGPFDGALGFSTGAALLAAYLLEKVHLFPGKPLPVQFAVFCSSIPPLSADPTYTKVVLESLSLDDQKRIRSGEDAQISQLPEPIRSSMSLTARSFDIMKPVHGRPRSDFFDRSILEVPCILRPDVYKARLSIPTLHCWSKNDPPVFKESARLVESFCHSRLRNTYHHSAIHNIPRSSAEVKGMVSAIDIMVSQKQQPRL